MSVFLGTGGGSFEYAAKIQAIDAYPGYPWALAAGDLNGDGIPDLVVTFPTSAFGAKFEPTILLGDGAGTGGFGTPTVLSAGLTPYAVAIADFNLDGIPDLVLADGETNNVAILLGLGSGQFSSPASYSTGGGAGSGLPVSVAVADFNSDGLPDVAVANQGGSVAVLLGSGAGALGSPLVFPGGLAPNGIAVADLNGDGAADLVVADENNNSVNVFLGTGTGGFGQMAEYPAGSAPWLATIADFNGDGIPDIVAADQHGGSISVLLGDGTGAFAAPSAYPTGNGPHGLIATDLNHDGQADVAVPNSGDETVSVLLNTCH